MLKQIETANICLNVERDCISVILDTPWQKLDTPWRKILDPPLIYADEVQSGNWKLLIGKEQGIVLLKH